MSAALPRIAIEPEPAPPEPDPDVDPLALLVNLVVRQRMLPQALTRNLIAALMEEGRRFARTKSGQRWRSMLVSSELASKGWELWNMLEMDALVAEAPASGDTPGAMLEDMLRKLHALKIEEFARVAGDAALHARGPHG